MTDPLGGSHLVEALTHELIDDRGRSWRRVEEHGGAVAAIEAGFYQEQIQESAYRHQRLVEAGERVIVGVNRFTETSQPTVPILRIDADLEAAQIERLANAARRAFSRPTCRRALDALRAGAQGRPICSRSMRTALAAHATVGEVCGVLRDVFGVHRPVVTV